jgi:hypothetical protein
VNERPSVSGFQDVCAGGVRLTRAPAYAGPAPHPVIVLVPGPGNADPARPFNPLYFSSRQLLALPALHAPLETMQLVACVARVTESPTGVRCLEPAAPLFTAAYQVTIRETRTGVAVATAPLAADERRCPSSATVVLGNQKVYTFPTENQFVELLRGFVTWNGTGARPQPPAAANPPATRGG